MIAILLAGACATNQADRGSGGRGASASGGAGGWGGAQGAGAASGGSSGSGGASTATGGATPASGGAPGAPTGGGGGGGTASSGGAPGASGASGGAPPSNGGAGGRDPSGAGGEVSGGRGGSSDGAAGGNGPGGNGGSAAGAVATIAGALATGITWMDDQGKPVNAHGGGLNREGDTFYLSGEHFTYDASASYDQNNDFKAFAMYSTTDFMHWKFERKILERQPSGELGPNRIGERPHIIKCPATGEYVLIAHAGSIDYQTDKEAVYATSTTINGAYTYKGPLKDSSGTLIVHSDMSAYVDGADAYVLTESGHVYKLASDCHGWTAHTSYSAMANMESPTVFKAGGTYFWLMSTKTGWRANDNEYATAPAITGPWTRRGLIAPMGERTWLSQSTCVLPIAGASGTVYLYQGDHWAGTEDTTGATAGKNNSLASYVLQPLVVSGTSLSMPKYLASWKLNIAAGTWSE
jgi:hypothetical protein